MTQNRSIILRTSVIRHNEAAVLSSMSNIGQMKLQLSFEAYDIHSYFGLRDCIIVLATVAVILNATSLHRVLSAIAATVLGMQVL